jgi:dTDP-glucose 4,6-dehydratase
MIINCLNQKPLPVYGEGTNVRDWLFVEDHAKALYMLLENGKKGETYNIGGKSEWKNIDLIKEIIRILAEIKNCPQDDFLKLITFVKDRPGHDFRYAIDCSKIEKEIGWSPDHNFSEGIKETIHWYLNNTDWIENVQSGAYQNWVDANYANR